MGDGGSSARTFRFGVQSATPTSASLGLARTVNPEPRWNELARRVEDHGYDVLSVPDHLDGQLAPLVSLAYAAALTDRVHLATTVLANDFRNPVVLTHEVATLAELSGDRFELGLGAGWKVADYDAAALAFAPASERIARLAESIALVRDALPTVPLMLGGGGRRMLALAAREADIVSVVIENSSGVAELLGESATIERVRERIAWVRGDAGARLTDLELHTRVFSAADEPQAAGLSADDAAASPHVLVRPARAMADKILRLRDELGFSYFTVSERYADEFAPVIHLLEKA
jgi:probable F420-dependent oxidoreductase